MTEILVAGPLNFNIATTTSALDKLKNKTKQMPCSYPHSSR